jgi:2-haloacid dehalogenase
MEGNVTAVVFDVGNVLLRWNPRNLYRKIFKSAEQMEWFLSHVCDGAWNEGQDRGRAWADAVKERIEIFPRWAAEIRAYDERWMETLDGVIEENVSILRTLKQASVPIYAITNFSKEKFSEVRMQHTFFDLFDGIVVSGEEQLIKPDPRVFRLFLDRYRISAAECLFIDDSRVNVAAAKELGMRVILYQEGLDLAAALDRHGMTLLQEVQTS